MSACHAAGDDPISPTCYPSRFFQWWNTVFPHPATELTNGALRRRNSGYFGYCNSHHLPDQTDLVIIELDTEDESCVSFFLSFLFRFFRFSSVSSVSLPFLSFLFRFFHTTVFFSLLFVTGLLRPPCAHGTHPILSNDGLSHQPGWTPMRHILLVCSFIPCHGFVMALPFSHIPYSYDHYHLPRSPFGRFSPLISHPSPFPISKKHPAS